MELFRSFSDTFWSTSVWLPPNTTWADIAPGSRPDVRHADYRDLIWPLPLALVLIVLRYLVEKHWISPIGKSLGIKSTRPKRAAPNPILEAAYNKNNRLRHKTKQSQLLILYGVIVLWDKPWFWDVKSCWYGYPHQSVENDIWWYYMISMSFYWALTVTQFFDNKRKDFWQMFIHHMITLLLMALSWVCNLHRVGSLVLVVHDCADILLEAAKITKYAKYQKICDCLFAAFTIVWIITRLGFYPRIIYSSSVEAPTILPMFPAYYIFNSLLILMLILHIVWTYIILQIAHTALKSGQIRSSSSEISDSSENPRPLTNGSPTKKLNSVNNSSIPEPQKTEKCSSTIVFYFPIYKEVKVNPQAHTIKFNQKLQVNSCEICGGGGSVCQQVFRFCLST